MKYPLSNTAEKILGTMALRVLCPDIATIFHDKVKEIPWQ
ncbi:MAG: hypothetical protein ACJAS1_001717 [Oleiphilaceae bacterium]|jgi:hypothetical protein